MALTAAQRAAYTEAVNAPGVRTDLRAHVLNLNQRHARDISDLVVGGQLDMSRKGDVNVSATLQLADLDNDLGGLDLTHLVRVDHGVKTEDFGWLWLPAITGWIAGNSDDGDTATLRLHDKSAFGLLPGAPNMKHDKGTPVGYAVHRMFSRIGENYFDIPKSLLRGGPRLAKDMFSGGPDEKKAPTRVARRMARGAGLHWFYAPDGRNTLRRPMRSPAISWRERDEFGGGQTSPIMFDRDFTTIRNNVVARGRKNLRLSVPAEPGHIYAPRNLTRGGVNLRLDHFFTDKSIAREKALREAATTELRRVLRERSEVRFSCAPNFLAATPWTLALAEKVNGRFAEFWLNECSIPFGDGDMTVGYHQVFNRSRKGR